MPTLVFYACIGTIIDLDTVAEITSEQPKQMHEKYDMKKYRAGRYRA